MAIPIAAQAGNMNPEQLRTRAESPEVAARTRKSTEAFHALQVTQRPAFVIENDIGDRAVFSGIVRASPLVATVDEMLADEAGYASWTAHFGEPPKP